MQGLRGDCREAGQAASAYDWWVSGVYIATISGLQAATDPQQTSIISSAIVRMQAGLLRIGDTK